MDKTTVKEAITIAVEVLSEARDSDKLEFTARDVIDLGKAILQEEGRNKRTSEINDAARKDGNEKDPGTTGDARKKGFPAHSGKNENGDRKPEIKDPSSPASKAQWGLLYRILEQKKLVSNGQKPSEYLLNYFGVSKASDITKGMASEAIDQLQSAKN